MEQMTGADAVMLYFESTNQPMTTGAVMVLDPSTMPDGYSFEAIRDGYLGREMVDLAKRRVQRVPGGVSHPVWVVDDHLDVDHHVERVVLADTGNGVDADQQLWKLAADELGRRFDRSRPLWHILVVEGLADGRIGIVFTSHHVAVDGVSGVQLMDMAFDLEPRPVAPTGSGPAIASDASGASPVPDGRSLLRWGARQRLRRWSAFPATASTMVRAVWARHRATAAADRDLDAGTRAPLLRGVPRTPWNSSITPARSAAGATVPLAEIRGAAKAQGVTINDLALSIVGGALRTFLLEQGALPARPLVAVCPVSIHDGAMRKGAAGNRWSAMRIPLATDEGDPRRRLAAIHRATAAARARHRRIGPPLWTTLAEHSSERLLGACFWLAGRLPISDWAPPVRNVVISNVRGPDQPLFFSGAEIVEMYPAAPVMDGCGLLVSVFTYRSRMYFTVFTCTDLLPDVRRIADLLRSTAYEIVDAAHDIRGADAETERIPTLVGLPA
jgi:WS/DGAT/MGAT family acyltransferase